MSTLVHLIQPADDASRQKIALHLLVAAMKSTTDSPLHFLYQEYEASNLLWSRF